MVPQGGYRAILRELVLLTVVLGASLVASGCTQKQDQTSDVSPISLSFPSLTFTLRESVALDAVWLNGSDRSFMIHVGKNFAGSYKLTLKKPDGTTVSADPARFKGGEEGYTDGWLQLPSRQSLTQHVLLGEWFDFVLEGTYHLAVEFDGSVQESAPNDTSTGQPPTLLHPSPLRFHRRVTTIQILPPDNDALRATCERLLAIAMTGETYEHNQEGIDAIKSLTYVRDPMAAEYLGTLLESGKLELSAIGALEQLGTVEARDVLSRRATRARSPGIQRIIQEAVQRMKVESEK